MKAIMVRSPRAAIAAVLIAGGCAAGLCAEPSPELPGDVSGRDSRRVDAEATAAARKPLRWYWGNIHCHSSYSDGEGLPQEAITHARDVAKLDFFSLTDHLEQIDDSEWADCQEQVRIANGDGDFVCLRGLEWTKEQGHGNIFEPTTYRWPEDRDDFFKAAADAGLIGMFNHPARGEAAWNGFSYHETGNQVMSLMEVRNDGELRMYVRALDAGWHIGAAGNDDAHSRDWGRGPWTVALAPALSRESILHALRGRHVYSSNDRNCRLMFRVNRTLMGTVREEPVETVNVLVRVMDPDENDAIAEIQLYEDGEVVETVKPGTARRVWRVRRTPSPGQHYYFVHVKQADGNVLTSAPVWVTVAEGESGAQGAVPAGNGT